MIDLIEQYEQHSFDLSNISLIVDMFFERIAAMKMIDNVNSNDTYCKA
jgi:hypothetical protein